MWEGPGISPAIWVSEPAPSGPQKGKKKSKSRYPSHLRLRQKNSLLGRWKRELHLHRGTSIGGTGACR